MSGQARLLVVDDEPSLQDIVATSMRFLGYQVAVAGTGREAVRLATDTHPDLIILDVMLPDFDGLEVMKRVRAAGVASGVVFLSARDTPADKIAGLTAGGDDYVTKPFSLEELVARLRALLSRTGAVTARERSILRVGDLELDEDFHEVRRGGVEIALTATEFELLRYFMRNPRRVLSKTQILDRVWHYDFGGQANIVELYVSYLRRKLDAGRSPMIHTLRGVGYVLKPGATDAAPR